MTSDRNITSGELVKSSLWYTVGNFIQKGIMIEVMKTATMMVTWIMMIINAMMIIIVAIRVTAYVTLMITLTFNYLQPIKPKSNGI